MKRIKPLAWVWVAVASYAGLANAAPTFYVQSMVAKPGALYSFHVVYNGEVHVKDFSDLSKTYIPITPNTPSFFPYGDTIGGWFPEVFSPPPSGPVLLEDTVRIDARIPDGSIYRVSIGPGSGPKGDDGQIIPGLKSHDGFLTVRNKPFFKGDLNDNGTPDIGDVIRSLQIAVGIGGDPTPYEWAAGDFNEDGSLTLVDTVLILRQWVLGLNPSP